MKTKLHLLLAALLTSIATCAFAADKPAAKGAFDPDDKADVTAAKHEGNDDARKRYSAYAGRKFPTRVYFGDTHHHTANSGDAFMGGNRLKPGEYWWKPQLSPSGPLIVLVSVPEQVMHVYRNGILIGRSTVSTGTKGHATPGGVFSILEKKQEHYSKKYDHAPMPNMQRLTWDGICMHSGNLPGYPASHGCIRLPFDFSQLLFSATTKGGTIVVGDGKVPVPHLASSPGLILAPKDFTPEMLRPLASNDYDWNPQRSTSGPITMVVSAADKTIYVYRNGNSIGRAPIEISGRGALGNHVFAMLDGTSNRLSSRVPGRSARRWMSVTSSGRGVDAEEIASRLRMNPEFAGKVYDTLTPGTTVIITDQTVVRNRNTKPFFES